MHDFGGYEISEKIYENERTMMFRGRVADSKEPVLIKVYKEANDTNEMTAYMYDFEMASKLHIKGVQKPAKFERFRQTYAFIFPDVKGQCLRKYVEQKNSENIIEPLEIAIRLAEIVERMHEQGIVHGNLRLDNIFVSSKTKEVRIIGFYPSQQLSR